MRIYCIPGLGFDGRIFDKLELLCFDLVMLNWIEPKREEGLESYAIRLAEGIPQDDNEIVLVGHSFGGILCQEIAKLRPCKAVILISSVKSRKELPFFFKVIAPLGIHHLFSKKLVRYTFPFWAKSHGYRTKEEQTLFLSMVGNNSDHYLQWALKALSLWQDSITSVDFKLLQIHGRKDKTFPISFINHPDYLLQDGNHFMVYQEAETISQIILKALI